MSKIAEEKQLRKHIERIDRQLLPPWGEWDGDYIKCPHCRQRQKQLFNSLSGASVSCPCCQGRFKKP